MGADCLNFNTGVWEPLQQRCPEHARLEAMLFAPPLWALYLQTNTGKGTLKEKKQPKNPKIETPEHLTLCQKFKKMQSKEFTRTGT